MLDKTVVEHGEFDHVWLGWYRLSYEPRAPTPAQAALLTAGGSEATVVLKIQRVKFAKNLWNGVLLPTNIAVVQFPGVRSATEAVIEVVNSGIGIQCIELCDDQYMRATNVYGMLTCKWLEKDSLFFKFQGPTLRALKGTADIVKKITEKHGGSGFALARNDQEARDHWMDRKNTLYSSLALFPGRRG